MCVTYTLKQILALLGWVNAVTCLFDQYTIGVKWASKPRQMGQRAKWTAWIPKDANALRRRKTYGEEPEDKSVHWWPLTGIRSPACTGELSALYQDLVWSQSIQGLFIIVRWQWDVPRKRPSNQSATRLRGKHGLALKRNWVVFPNHVYTRIYVLRKNRAVKLLIANRIKNKR